MPRIKLLGLVLFSSVRYSCGILGLLFWDHCPSEMFPGKPREERRKCTYFYSLTDDRGKGHFGTISSANFMREEITPDVTAGSRADPLTTLVHFILEFPWPRRKCFSTRENTCFAICKNVHLQRKALFSEIRMAVWIWDHAVKVWLTYLCNISIHWQLCRTKLVFQTTR